MLRASGDSAGRPVPKDPSALTPLPHYLPTSFFFFSLFRPLLVGGYGSKVACTTTARGLGLERLARGKCGAIL
eukprot:scaffold12855_cov124-Isochrysis_galbana.AAC.1